MAKRDLKPGVEVEEELEPMTTLASETVFDDPTAFVFVESDDSAMRDRRRETMIAVMLGIKHIAFIIAFPGVDSRADVWA